LLILVAICISTENEQYYALSMYSQRHINKPRTGLAVDSYLLPTTK